MASKRVAFQEFWAAFQRFRDDIRSEYSSSLYPWLVLYGDESGHVEGLPPNMPRVAWGDFEEGIRALCFVCPTCLGAGHRYGSFFRQQEATEGE